AKLAQLKQLEKKWFQKDVPSLAVPATPATPPPTDEKTMQAMEALRHLQAMLNADSDFAIRDLNAKYQLYEDKYVVGTILYMRASIRNGQDAYLHNDKNGSYQLNATLDPQSLESWNLWVTLAKENSARAKEQQRAELANRYQPTKQDRWWGTFISGNLPLPI